MYFVSKDDIKQNTMPPLAAWISSDEKLNFFPPVVYSSAQVSDKLVSLEMENMDHMEKGNIDKAIESIKQEITLIQGAFTWVF